MITSGGGSSLEVSRKTGIAHKGGGMLPEVVSPYLKQLIRQTGSNALRLQFWANPEDELASPPDQALLDPLLEEKHRELRGLVYKYRGDTGSGRHGRALVLLTVKCASYCRFCTRGRMVGSSEPPLSKKEIDEICAFVISHPELNELILSGGDPLTAPPELLRYTLRRFSDLPQIEILRIDTRLPVHNPHAVSSEMINAIRQIPLPYVLVHVNHPAELSKDARGALTRLRRETGSILRSQSVFLRGVNDSVDILYDLFTGLIKIGVVPYYIFHNDPVPWAQHFTIPLEEEVRLLTDLRRRMTGLAWPTHVVDVPGGFGKLPVPLGFWNSDLSHYRDFAGNERVG